MRRYQVHALSVFGSAARGDMKPGSDIDILAEFEPDAPIGHSEFAGMEDELRDLLGRKVDLVSKRGLKPRVRPYVFTRRQSRVCGVTPPSWRTFSKPAIRFSYCAPAGLRTNANPIR